MDKIFTLFTKDWRMIIVLAVITIVALVSGFVFYTISKRCRFNPRVLTILAGFVVVIVVVKNLISEKSFSPINEWIIATANAVMFAYSAIFLLDTQVKSRKLSRIDKRGIGYLIILAVVVLLPLFFTQNFHDIDEFTVVFFGIKYINYLGFLADIVTVIGILVALKELYSRIELEDKFLSVIDEYFKEIDSTKLKLQADEKEIKKNHSHFIDKNVNEYRLFTEYYSNDLIKLDYVIYYCEVRELYTNILGKVNDKIPRVLVDEYIYKRKKQERKKDIKRWLKAEIKKSRLN